MNYIQKNLLSGEEIKYVARLHFFLFVQPIILLLIGAFLASSPKEISAMTRYTDFVLRDCIVIVKNTNKSRFFLCSN